MRNYPVYFGLLLFGVLLLNLLTVFSLPAGKGDLEVRPVTDWMDCYDIFNNPYVETIPHANCSLYMLCQQDNEGRPNFPVLRFCNNNLHFNFETCQCDWAISAKCFDPNNDDHKQRRFQCACATKPDGNGGWVPVDPEDDRCSVGREDDGRRSLNPQKML